MSLHLALPLKIRGETVENFISEAQDRSRNALAKSLEAGFNAFCEQLSTDQMQYEQTQLLNHGNDNIELLLPHPNTF